MTLPKNLQKLFLPFGIDWRLIPSKCTFRLESAIRAVMTRIVCFHLAKFSHARLTSYKGSIKNGTKITVL